MVGRRPMLSEQYKEWLENPSLSLPPQFRGHQISHPFVERRIAGARIGSTQVVQECECSWRLKRGRV
jgi:hypothetical protein